MPILRDDHPQVGCLALPMSAIGGFVVIALVAAAVGAGAGAATVAGILGGIGGTVVALLVLRPGS